MDVDARQGSRLDGGSWRFARTLRRQLPREPRSVLLFRDRSCAWTMCPLFVRNEPLRSYEHAEQENLPWLAPATVLSKNIRRGRRPAILRPGAFAVVHARTEIVGTVICPASQAHLTETMGKISVPLGFCRSDRHSSSTGAAHDRMARPATEPSALPIPTVATSP